MHDPKLLWRPCPAYFNKTLKHDIHFERTRDEASCQKRPVSEQGEQGDYDRWI